MSKLNLVFLLAILLILNACQKTDLTGGTGMDASLESALMTSENLSSVSSTLSTTTPNTFTLINADSNKDIIVISEGDVINLATLASKNLNIRANINSEGVGSVVWALSGKQTKNVTEATSPYALFGNEGSNYNKWTPAIGNYTLKATAFSAAKGNGNLVQTISINFSVIDKVVTDDAISTLPTTTNNTFALINSDSDKDITVITNNANFDLNKLGTNNLNIRANINPSGVGSVIWALTGKQTKNATEATAPYALFGNTGTNYNNWTPAVGNYSLKVTAYTGSNGSGSVLHTFTVNFTVSNSTGTTPPPPPPVDEPVTDDNTTTPVNTNLLVYSNFETSSSLNVWGKEVSRADAVTISNVVSRKGISSVRFELTLADVEKTKMTRAEIKQGVQKESEAWYGMSVFLPNDFVKDGIPEIISQWHAYPDLALGEQWISPPLALTIKDDRYFVTILYSSAKVTNSGNWTKKEYDLGPVEKNKWTDWAFRIKWSYGSDGILEIYKNKQRLVNYIGPNSFNDEYYPYFKLGIYKWGWNGWASSSSSTKRVLYFDEVKIGDRNSSLNAVSPN